MPIDAAQQLQRYKILDNSTERQNFKSYYEDVARYCAPRRMGFQGPRTPGDRRVTPQIYNPIGIQCTQTLAAALHGMMMNPATNWLKIRLVDSEINEQESARAWMDDLSKRIMAGLTSPDTSFHTHANQLLEDLAGFGTAAMYCGQQNTGHLFVRTYSINEVVIAENQYGRIDTVMRATEYTVRQAVQTWGDKVSTKTKELYDKGDYDKPLKVIHLCTPRNDYDRTKRDKLNMPYAICYIEEMGQHVLEESGVEEMPWVVPRWWVATGEVYGRSPAMTALPQIKVANAAQKTILDAAEKAVNPPLTVPHEGLISPVRTSPGGLTYLRNKQEIGQLPTSANLPFAAEWLQALNNEIRTTMFVDQLQFTGDMQMTATEVIQRSTERMRLLGPVLGRLENEFLNPLVTRVFGIMHRLNLFPKPPEEIQGQDMRIEYQSPLARAQKSQLAQGFQQVIATLEPLAKLGPEIASQLFAPIDMSKITPELFDWYGVDTSLLKKDDTMEQENQQANQQKMVMQMLPMIMKALKDGGAGIGSLAGAAVDGAQASGMANAASSSPATQPGGGGAPSPPASPGQPGAPPLDLSTLIGSLARGGAQAAPAALGSPANASAAYAGAVH